MFPLRFCVTRGRNLSSLEDVLDRKAATIMTRDALVQAATEIEVQPFAITTISPPSRYSDKGTWPQGGAMSQNL